MRRSRQTAREDTPEARRIRASKLAHEREGITKTASALTSPPAAPRDSRTLATLRSKPPTEDAAAIATGEARVEHRAGITAVGEQEQQLNVTSELLDTQSQTLEVENLFEDATVKSVIKKVNPHSTEGPSGLRYSHLQDTLCDELVEVLAAFATLVFSSRVLPQVFWTLHTSANLSVLGQKARPVTCGDVLQRVIGAVFCRRYGSKLADYFQSWASGSTQHPYQARLPTDPPIVLAVQHPPTPPPPLPPLSPPPPPPSAPASAARVPIPLP